uniref:Phospholipase A2-like domain-containing protein n=1 Tax=Rhodnius prolixus TaxID=13249 RepID=T1HG70_RHOPR
MDKPLVLTGVGGKGIINSVINNLPFELHIPGYRFCGPGTKLQHRIHQTGINPLDDACKAHDIAYSQSKSLESRHKADQLLEQEAWKRLTTKNSSLSEKTSALMVGNMMKAKVKLGAGNKKRPTFN